VVIEYGLFFRGKEEEIEAETNLNQTEINMVINGFSSGYVTLSCQTCRKLKKYKEIEQDLVKDKLSIGNKKHGAP
jgi:hypothetical protein